MQGEADKDRPKSDFAAAKHEFADKLEQEKRSATEALHEARDEITAKAGEYASEAKDALFQQAEGAQRSIGANLTALGGALRAAGEHLAKNDQPTVSKLASNAAGGLERLSSSLKNRPFEDVLREIRAFGRENSGALIAGSVLAGLALGRFLKSSTSNTSTGEASRPGAGGTGTGMGSMSPTGPISSDVVAQANLSNRDTRQPSKPSDQGPNRNVESTP
ncbi:hypothetical protein [Pseudaminobacter sp. NGMCC 1.201702]|uniref:hypothetical protein n=1 Tax=Pseudaminobacter sp. NGMCC 1.201702 TaxID=3391825 RepID=UPI0039EFF9CD